MAVGKENDMEGRRGMAKVRESALFNQNFLEGGHFWEEGRFGNFIIVINQLILASSKFSLDLFGISSSI